MFNAKDYLGIPYLNMGRDKKGLDCWGIVMLIYKNELGIDLMDSGCAYPTDWSKKGLNFFSENADEYWVRVSKPKEYDVLAFKNSLGIVNHVGVSLGGNRFIHCPKAGVSIANLTQVGWKKKFIGSFRLKNDYSKILSN